MQYEWNARNQITLWGPRGEIRDYATKQWAGVVADYFKPRWEVFIREMQLALEEKRSFNKKAFATAVFTAIEEPFTFSTKAYTDVAIGENRRIICCDEGSSHLIIQMALGDSIVKGVQLYNKWRKVYQHAVDTLSPKTRKLWLLQVLPAQNKTRTAKEKKRKQKSAAPLDVLSV